MTQLTAELHSHTNFSDGLLSPRELVTKVQQIGFKHLAITDHDNMRAYRHLIENGFEGDIELIPGIEVSCTGTDRDVHILGYFMDAFHPELIEYEETFRADRLRRAEKMVERLNALKVNITIEDVLDQADSAPVGRPHVAAVLVRGGFVPDIQAAFDRYLENNGPGYAPRSPFSVKEGVDLIKRMGGVAVVAHPGRTFTDPQAFLKLVASGIDGIEAFHPSHWSVTREYYRTLAEQHSMLLTGGSDYHGSREYDERNFGVFGATTEMVEALRNKAAQRSSPGL
jgi:predicted metal-dependent phosphoesterase TrpH